jgi:hypothetical protein
LFGGNAGCADSRFADVPASVMPAKSFVTSNEVLYRLWITENGSAAPKSV